MYLTRSGKISTGNHDTEKIYIIYQFFVHPNAERNKEMQQCLRFNVENPHIDKIYLLNEKMYTNKELGVESAGCSTCGSFNTTIVRDRGGNVQYGSTVGNCLGITVMIKSDGAWCVGWGLRAAVECC